MPAIVLNFTTEDDLDIVGAALAANEVHFLRG